MDLYTDELCCRSTSVPGSKDPCKLEGTKVAALVRERCKAKCLTGRLVDILPVNKDGNLGRLAGHKDSPPEQPEGRSAGSNRSSITAIGKAYKPLYDPLC